MQNLYDKLYALRKRDPSSVSRFFKTDPGAYGERDRFLGVPVPEIRSLIKQAPKVWELNELNLFLSSPYNEARLMGLLLLVEKMRKSRDAAEELVLLEFYYNHRHFVNNWNLVDSSAPDIVGRALFHRNKDLLIELAHSESLWDRRIAMVATLFFVRKNSVEWTFRIAQMLQNDSCDLIHKAVGWILREAGKKEQRALEAYLEQNAAAMPRTMLRYAIEKFPKERQKFYRSL